MERVIGRVKNYSILKGVLPLSMSRIANQIIYVYAFLDNIQPVLLPPPLDDATEMEVENYFESVYDSDYDADTEFSDEDM